MNEKSERLFYSCNQCGAIHEAGIRPVLCSRIAIIANALDTLVIGLSVEDAKEISRMARTDEELHA